MGPADQGALGREIDSVVRARIPDDLTELIDALVAELGARDDLDGIAVGQQAPRFVLPNVLGDDVALDDLLASGPVVLVFYRGAWCPICNLELASFRAVHEEIRAVGATLVAVSPQAPDASLSLTERLGLDFEVLSDIRQAVVAEYRLQFELTDPLRSVYERFGLPLSEQNADGTWRLPVPATFVLDPDGVVVARHVEVDYRRRMEPAAVLAALADLRR